MENGKHLLTINAKITGAICSYPEHNEEAAETGRRKVDKRPTVERSGRLAKRQSEAIINTSSSSSSSRHLVPAVSSSGCTVGVKNFERVIVMAFF
jgi:hypothetical protein